MKMTKFFALLCAVAGFAACTPAETPSEEPAPEAKGKLTLTADKTQIEMGESIKFTVTMKDEETGETTDITSLAKLYDSNLDPVSNPFTPQASGNYTINATYGAESSNNVDIMVMATMPDFPADPQPDNYAFNHRVVLTDHTGVNCPYCPQMVDKLEQLAKTEYHNHYNEVTCHGNGGNLTAGDPANSQAAELLGQFHSSALGNFGMPTVIVNFYAEKVVNSAAALNNLKSAIDSAIKKDGAEVGISMAVAGDKSNVYCAAQIKSAETKEYKVVAWLLESGIYSANQAGAQKDSHRIYNYAIRNISGEFSRANVSGESVGVIEEGKTKEFAVSIPITSTKWKPENMGVLVIVSAKDAQGRWEVANSAYCSVNDGVKEFEYIAK